MSLTFAAVSYFSDTPLTTSGPSISISLDVLDKLEEYLDRNREKRLKQEKEREELKRCLEEHKQLEAKRRLAERKLQQEERRQVRDVKSLARSPSRLHLLRRGAKVANNGFLAADTESLLRPASSLIDILDAHVPPGTLTQIDSNPADIQLNAARLHSEMFDEAKYQDMRAPFGEVQDQYAYMPLKPRHIRLLRYVRAKSRWAHSTIVVRLLQVPLGDLPRYEALSYRWGNCELPSYIICEGKKLAISRSCKAALEQFQIANRLLWVDSICINQNDVKEKNEQVSLMSTIYSSAERTLVWLGRDEDLAANCLLHIEASFQHFRKKSDRQASKGDLKNPILKMVYEEMTPSGALKALFRREWFKRIWILQEVALAKNILIQCGTQTASWAALAIFLRRLNDGGILPPSWRHAWNLVTFRNEYQRNKDFGGINIYTAMVQSRSCEATNLRDKVYALLGVCEELAELVGTPDYSLSVREVWTMAAQACLRSSLSVNSLSLVSCGMQDPSLEDLPSWVAHLDKSRRTWIRRPRLPGIADGVIIADSCFRELNCLRMRGHVLGEVLSKCDGGSSKDELLAAWKTWWEHYQQSPTFSFGINEIATFWKTLYCDVDDSVNDEAELCIWHGKFLKDDLKSLGREALANLRVSELVDCTSRRTFGRVTQGIGFFPEGVNVGDKVAVFSGATTPFILRRSLQSQGNAYQLVGPCYVRCLMGSGVSSSKRAKFRELLIV